MRDVEVSVVIPTYNEEENIAGIIREVGEVLADREHEILVVDGASTDGTAGIVEDIADENSSVRLIRKERKEGIGAAYKEGFSRTRGDVVVQMDADFSHPPEKIPDLVEAVEKGADVAVGSRYVDDGDRKDPLHRRIFPVIGSYLYRFLLQSPVRDITSGFKAYRNGRSTDISEADLPDGFHFQAASLFYLLEQCVDVEEIPITFRERRAGTPKYEYPGDLLDNTFLLAKLGIKKHVRMLKFATVGAFGMAVHMGLLFLLTEFVGFHYLVSGAIAVETAIIFNFIFNDTWTFADRRVKGAKNLMERFTKYQLVSMAGLVLNLAILWALTDLVGIYYLISNAVAIGIVFFWNYFVNFWWTWTG